MADNEARGSGPLSLSSLSLFASVLLLLFYLYFRRLYPTVLNRMADNLRKLGLPD